MPRDRDGASNIGTFACRTFPCDTKASNRAKHTVNDICILLISADKD